MSSERPFLSHFSPQWTDPRYLEEILVQRGDLLAESVDAVRDSILTDRRHHLLFIGPRGAGKTHLITLIQHRLGQDPDLTDHMRVAWLNEDETATSFLRLLIAIYRSLHERHPDEFATDTIERLSGKDPSLAEEQLTRDLLRDLNGRIIVCLMENLDSLFRCLSEAEQRNWRAFLQNHPVVVTVGTAQALFDGIADHDEPFFGFFDTRHLQPLSADEARDLLERIARLHEREDLVEFLGTSAGRARVDAIRALAGGNPRLYLIFSDLLVNAAALDDLVRPFEEMVDRQLTSYYQERLRWLSPQQREIVQFLCRSSSPVPVKRIADALFTTHNSITGQLKQLREFRYVDSHKLGREVLYELAEPLMRLALQVKETHDRRPLALIVDFLRIWHERKELEELLDGYPADSTARSYLETAHGLMLTGPNLRHELFRRDLDLAGSEECDDVALEKARALAEEGKRADFIRLGSIRMLREEWGEAIDSFTSVIDSEVATTDELADALVRRGYGHLRSGQTSSAEEDFTRVIALPNAPTEHVAQALVSRGIVRIAEGQPDMATRDCTQAVDLPGAPPERIAWALFLRGFVHDEGGRTEEAISDYNRTIELPDAPPRLVALALVSRGHAHGQAGRTDLAIADASRVIGLSGAPSELVAMALVNRGYAHGQAGRMNYAIADSTRAIELADTPPDSLARALVNRSAAYAQIGQSEQAIADSTRAIEHADTPPDSLARALANRGATYAQSGKMDRAIVDSSRAIEMPGAPPHEIARALCNRATCNAVEKQHEAALHDFDRLFMLPNQEDVRNVLAGRIHFKAREVVNAAFSVTTDATRWSSILTEFAGHFARFDGLTQLGEAAVKHLPTLAASPLNHAAWDAWADAWESARDALPEEDRDQLDIPLRLLRAGIAWLKTEDEAHLLSLRREERRILREALGLSPEQ